MDVLLRMAMSARSPVQLEFVLEELERTRSRSVEDRIIRNRILEEATTRLDR